VSIPSGEGYPLPGKGSPPKRDNREGKGGRQYAYVSPPSQGPLMDRGSVATGASLQQTRRGADGVRTSSSVIRLTVAHSSPGNSAIFNPRGFRSRFPASSAIVHE
jgi:hypothetical protein